MASVTDWYSSLEGQRVRESERLTEGEREMTIKARSDYASEIREQRYVSEPIEKSVFQNLTVDYIWEWWDLNSQRVGKGKNVKGGMVLKLCEFETLQ